MNLLITGGESCTSSDELKNLSSSIPLSCLTVLTGNKLVLRDYLAPELLDKLAPIGPG